MLFNILCSKIGIVVFAYTECVFLANGYKSQYEHVLVTSFSFTHCIFHRVRVRKCDALLVDHRCNNKHVKRIGTQLSVVKIAEQVGTGRQIILGAADYYAGGGGGELASTSQMRAGSGGHNA
jgi:hypothetical protein